MYKLAPFFFPATEPNQVQRLSDSAFIPFDPANTDYQEYLKWVAEGGVPEPADQPE
jgi:hypothetical protein